MAERVFCQIVAREISPHTCRELQQTHEPEHCFGCGACTRRCAVCREQTVVFPEIDLCQAHLVVALQQEVVLTPEELEDRADKLTYCQLVRRAIAPSMCLASQNEVDCNLCRSPYRFCSACKQRVVRYPEYGLCLHCTVERYQTTPCGAAAPHSQLPALPIAQLPPPVPDDEALYQAACDLVARKEIVSVSLLSRWLRIKIKRAWQLLERLEAEKVIGPAVHLPWLFHQTLTSGDRWEAMQSSLPMTSGGVLPMYPYVPYPCQLAHMERSRAHSSLSIRILSYRRFAHPITGEWITTTQQVAKLSSADRAATHKILRELERDGYIHLKHLRSRRVKLAIYFGGFPDPPYVKEGKSPLRWDTDRKEVESPVDDRLVKLEALIAALGEGEMTDLLRSIVDQLKLLLPLS